jgi:hypothetical protein
MSRADLSSRCTTPFSLLRLFRLFDTQLVRSKTRATAPLATQRSCRATAISRWRCNQASGAIVCPLTILSSRSTLLIPSEYFQLLRLMLQPFCHRSGEDQSYSSHGTAAFVQSYSNFALPLQTSIMSLPAIMFTDAFILFLQVKDQSYSSSGNAALVQSYETKTPVRVFRSKPVKKETGKWCPPIYTYEGLYRVLQHRLVPSADGPLVRGVLDSVCLQRRTGFVRTAMSVYIGVLVMRCLDWCTFTFDQSRWLRRVASGALPSTRVRGCTGCCSTG